jgi:RimJ/RimL family protein N-acetyltransferase
VIEEKITGKAVGSCQLLNIDMRHRNAELQIRIGEESHQGQGLGSEAVRLLCDFGFRDLNLHRIYLRVFTTNSRAISAYKKCGFKEEGVSQEAAFIDGAWVNVLGMGILNKYE